MNYNNLLYFSVLAETEHYTQAAARLGISQPSLSSAIHNLENDLGGVRLFEKVGRNVRLTDHGKFYHQKVNAALEELRLASRILRDSKEDAPIVIRLGIVSGTLNGIVADEITNYIQNNPRIRFQLVESSAEDLMALLRQEKLDMAVVDSTSRDPSFHFRMLCKRNFYIALPSSHPLAAKTIIQPQEVLSLPQVVFNYDVSNSFMDWANGSPADENVVCQVNTVQSAIDMVAAGVGISLVPDSCVCEREDVSFVLLENWHQALYMCILYDRWLEPSIWQFRENLVHVIRKNA